MRSRKASPAGFWYDQHQHEWVIVLKGAARLRFEDQTMEMKPGDFVDIPAHVKRAVWLRDGGRCGFVTAHGRRCTERAFLEFHHRQPYAMGGETTVALIPSAVPRRAVRRRVL